MAKLNHALDPRLRRLIRTMDDRERLTADAERAVVFAAAADLVPATAVKPVLVMLGEDRIPEGFSDLRWVRIVDRIYAVDVPAARLEALAQASPVEYVEAGRAMRGQLNTSIPETGIDRVQRPASGSGYDGTGVAVGIIDFGLDYTMDDFRDASGGTRVAFLWDQSLDPQPGESSPAGFSFGVEYDAAAISAALAAPDPFAVVRHRPEPGSHGTHVAGIAAGNGRSHDASFPAGVHIGAAPGATLIFVQPRHTGTANSFTDSTDVAAAISYIFNKADELGMPCVVNMSLGQNGGSHDGESIVERAIDRHLDRPGRAFVVAAGNEHVWRGHAAGRIASGGTATLDWAVGGGMPTAGGTLPPSSDRTPNEMEIWYASRDAFRVRLRDPAGNATSWIDPGDTQTTMLGTDQVFITSERFTALNGDAQIYIEMSPTGAGGWRLQSGIWKLEITGLSVRDGRYHAFIERDLRDPANSFGDQSYFAGASFDPQVTLGTPATCRRGIAVANYVHRTMPERPNASSSRGPTRLGLDKPEIAAPGTDIVAAHALGGRPASTGGIWPTRVAMTGTSMAAPHVAGCIALVLQKDPDLTAAQIRAMLIAAAIPPAGVTSHDPAWGHGRLEAEAALALV